MKAVFIIVPVVVIALFLLAGSQWRQQAFFVSGMIEADDIRIGSRVGGRVKAVRAVEGQRVAAGDVIIELDPFDLRERLSESNATLAAREAQLQKLTAGYRVQEIEQAAARSDRVQAELDKLIAGPRPLEIQMLEDKLSVAETDLTNAQYEYDRLKNLHGQGQAIEKEMEDATRLFNSAQAKAQLARDELALAKEGTRAEEVAAARAVLAEAQQALDLFKSGYRAEEIAEAKAQVDAARAVVSATQILIDELTIRSPGECVVDALDLQPGDLIAANAPVATLLDPTKLWVRAYVPENRLDVQIDQKVWLKVDSYPGQWFTGRLSFIARDAEFTPNNVQTPEERVKQVFRIKVLIEEGKDKLRPGMSADVYFDDPQKGTAR